MPLSFSEIDSIAQSGRTPQIDGERVTTILPDNYQSARSVTVLDGPSAGNLTVNPDNSLSLVMTGSDHTGPISFRVEVVNSNGTTSRETIDLRVTPPSQEAGWGTGENHYMLETDARGDLVIETGNTHRDVYISAAGDALSIADIAAREGISRANIDGEWLAANREYGANPNMALAPDAGMALWRELHEQDGPNSHWLHLERGHTYNNLDVRALLPRGLEGEDELHPVVITAYGSGTQPRITSDQLLSGDHFSNIVMHDLAFTNELLILGPDDSSGNMILDTITATQEGRVNAQHLDGLTMRNLTFHDIAFDRPANGGAWEQGVDRITGVFVTDTDGVLVENSVFTETGWSDGYDAVNAAGNRGQAPSQFSHNIYIQADVTDMTFRDNVSAQASSYGGQLRSGGFVEDNLFLDNNAGFIVRGGDFFGYGPIGNFSLLSGNVVTSGAHKEVGNWPGALTRGFVNGARDTVLLDNVVAHLTDPDRPWEIQEKYESNPAIINDYEPFYDNSVVYRWDGGSNLEYNLMGEDNQNLGGLNLARLDDATAANLAKQLLDNPNATMNQLVDWLADNNVSADQMLNFFKQPFGTAPDSRSGATDVRFVPSELTDGVRWDNRENWSTGDVAGTFTGDQVDLGGNWVVYGGTHSIRSLDFGDGGQLLATNGRLNITGQVTAGTGGATLELDAAGQVWMGGGYAGASALNVMQDGGRFANTGVISGNVNLFIDDGQALLSAEGGDFVLGRGETLTIRGADASVGFDGALNREGIIRFDSGSDVVIASDGSGLGSIGEFRSGAYLEAPRVDSNINLGGMSLTVDLRAASQPNGTYVLMSADDLTGSLGSFSIQGQGSRSATLTINYTTDEVTLAITSGSGVRTVTVGDSGGTGGTGDSGGTGGTGDSGGTGGTGDSGGTGGTGDSGGTGGNFNLITVTNTDWRMDATAAADAFIYEAGVNTGYDVISGFNLREDVLVVEDGRGGYLDTARIGEHNGRAALFLDNDRTVVLEGLSQSTALNNIDLIFGDAGNLGGGTGDSGGTGGNVNLITVTNTDWRMDATAAADAFIYEAGVNTGYDVISGFNLREDVLVVEDGRGGYLDFSDIIRTGEHNGRVALFLDNDRTVVLEGISRNSALDNPELIFGDAGDLSGAARGASAGWTISELDAATSNLFVYTHPDNLPSSLIREYDNQIEGNANNSILTGTSARETILAGAGNDVIAGNGNNDLIFGGEGNDRITGDGGSDIIHAAQDDDYVDGGWGNDFIGGGWGNDELIGGDGDDNIFGSQGRDQISGDAGSDILTGGDDGDVFIFARNGSDWDDVITDFRYDEDVLVLGNSSTGFLTRADVDISDYNGSAVISHQDGYILLQGVGVNTIVNNAGAVFGDAGDLLFA